MRTFLNFIVILVFSTALLSACGSVPVNNITKEKTEKTVLINGQDTITVDNVFAGDWYLWHQDKVGRFILDATGTVKEITPDGYYAFDRERHQIARHARNLCEARNFEGIEIIAFPGIGMMFNCADARTVTVPIDPPYDYVGVYLLDNSYTTVRLMAGDPKIYCIPSGDGCVMKKFILNTVAPNTYIPRVEDVETGNEYEIRKQAKDACDALTLEEVERSWIYVDCGSIASTSSQTDAYTIIDLGIHVYLTDDASNKTYYIPGSDGPQFIEYVLHWNDSLQTYDMLWRISDTPLYWAAPEKLEHVRTLCTELSQDTVPYEVTLEHVVTYDCSLFP